MWDDHESANDSYVDGAENHQPASEGDWQSRKAASKQAYFEWLPIRENATDRVYRKIAYGDLLDLFMLDTRLEARDSQILDIANPLLYAPDRELLGEEQRNWLFTELANSTARWKLLGQQVIFSDFNVGWAGPSIGMSFEQTESIFLDIWDGYPAEKARVYGFLQSNNIDNTIILSGDFHSSFAFDVALPPVDLQFVDVGGGTVLPFYFDTASYIASTGIGSRAVEFVTPSISSANFDENLGPAISEGLELQINMPITIGGGIDLGNPNPHMKFVDLDRHGYYILDVKPDSAQANFYYTPILQITDSESFGKALHTVSGSNHLSHSLQQSAPKIVQDEPAPADPPLFVNNRHLVKPAAVLSLHPNPVKGMSTLQYILPTNVQQLDICLIDPHGRVVKELLSGHQVEGVYTIRTDLSALQPGTYFYKITADGHSQIQKLIVL